MKNEGSDEQDIQDVFAEERSRGARRRPLRAEQRRKYNEIRRGVLKALREKDERGFTALLRQVGIRDETPEFARALKRFRELCGRSGG